MTLPVSQACGCWGLMRGVWHHQDRRRRGPRELTGIVDLTRGEDHPTALDPFQGQKERHRRSTPRRHQRLDAFHIVKIAGDAPGEVRRPRPARHDWSPRPHRRPPLPRSAISCTPHTCRLTKRQQERLREAFTADEAHVSVDVAYLHRASVRGLPPSHTRPRPTPGRTPHRAPTSLSHPRNRSPRGEPYASGRTPSWPTSTPAEQATGQQKPSTESSN